MERQLSNGSLLPKMSRPFDHGITAMLLIIFGTFGLAVGGTMTGLAYGYEKGEQFTTVSEYYNLRCDIVGPVLLAIGGVGILVALFMIAAFGVCAKPEWSTHEVPQAVPGNSHTTEVLIEKNSILRDGRR